MSRLTLNKQLSGFIPANKGDTMERDNKPKAVWTLVQSVETNGMLRSFYFSDGGAVKITRHTDKGEAIVLMMPAVNLEDLACVSAEFGKVFEAFQTIADEVKANKEKRKEASKLANQEQRVLTRAANSAQAALEALNRIQQQIEDRRKRSA